MRIGILVIGGFAYFTKIENGKLDFAQFRSEQLVRSMAAAQEADVAELLLLAEKIPEDTKGGFWNARMCFGRSYSTRPTCRCSRKKRAWNAAPSATRPVIGTWMRIGHRLAHNHLRQANRNRRRRSSAAAQQVFVG
ncbi:MAG: hypothetical protein RBS80_13790 [Thermoguttaceae bacterium]|jgi:hypothetical protein|nr:hypothetical protein [Thermoguttaceae bacterium]